MHRATHALSANAAILSTVRLGARAISIQAAWRNGCACLSKMLLAIRSLSMTCHQSRPYSSSRWPAVSKHSSALANRFLWLEHVSSLSAAGSWGYQSPNRARLMALLEVTVVEPDASRRRVALSMGANRALPPEADVGILRLMDFVMIGPHLPLRDPPVAPLHPRRRSRVTLHADSEGRRHTPGSWRARSSATFL